MVEGGRDTPRLSQLGGATWVHGPEKAKNAGGRQNWFNVGHCVDMPGWLMYSGCSADSFKNLDQSK